MNEVRLHESSIEAVARRLAELLRDDVHAGELIDAAEVARRFGVARSWVYDHAEELGALPLGGGSRPRLRFDPEIVAARLQAHRGAAPGDSAGGPKRPGRRPRKRSIELLPIKDGRSE